MRPTPEEIETMIRGAMALARQAPRRGASPRSIPWFVKVARMRAAQLGALLDEGGLPEETTAHLIHLISVHALLIRLQGEVEGQSGPSGRPRKL